MNDTEAESPLALQLAARVEKVDSPTTSAICAAAVLATISLLEDERSQPDGEWHDAVSAWNGARIRKIVRRGRASAWQRAQVPCGITVERDGVEVRAFVSGPLDQAPDALIQIHDGGFTEIPAGTKSAVAWRSNDISPPGEAPPT